MSTCVRRRKLAVKSAARTSSTVLSATSAVTSAARSRDGPGALGDRATRGVQGGLRVCPAQAPCRQKREHDTREQREAEAEGQHFAVQPHLVQSWQVGGSAGRQHTHGGPRHRNAE